MRTSLLALAVVLLTCAATAPSVGAVARASSLPNGTYRFTLVRSDLERAGVRAAGDIKGNSGTWTWKLTTGRWQWTLRAPGSGLSSGHGTYALKGSRACFVDTTGSRFAIGCWRWKLQGTALVFFDPLPFSAETQRQAGGDILTAIFTSHPWKRVA